MSSNVSIRSNVNKMKILNDKQEASTCDQKLKVVKEQYNFIQEQIWWGQLNHLKPSNWLLHEALKLWGLFCNWSCSLFKLGGGGYNWEARSFSNSNWIGYVQGIGHRSSLRYCILKTVGFKLKQLDLWLIFSPNPQTNCYYNFTFLFS